MDEDFKRVSVIAFILAIFFGILQNIPKDKTYDSIVLETVLKLISDISFSLVLFPFLIYFLLVAINIGYDTKNILPKKLLKFVYNFAILILLFIITFTVFYCLLLNISIIFNLNSMIIFVIFIIFFIFSIISFGIIFLKYIR